MEWKDLSESARNTMEELGDFGPTVNPSHCLVKGYINEEKTYWDSNDLRTIAKSLVEVADWLEKRADS